MSKYRTDSLAPLAQIFKALAHPQRLRIFLKLATCCEGHSACDATPEGVRRCVGDLGENLGLAPSTVSHHLRELRQSGLIHVARKGQRIECWVSGPTIRQLQDFFSLDGLSRLTLPEGASLHGTDEK